MSNALTQPVGALPAFKAQWPGVAGRFFGVLTDASGASYALIVLDARAKKRCSWQAQMDWAAGLEGDLLSPLEGAHLVATEPGLIDKWVWLNKEDGAGSAWTCTSYGDQSYNNRSAEGGGVAVRRFPLGSFDPLKDATQRAGEGHAALRQAAQEILAACDQAETAVAELGARA